VEEILTVEKSLAVVVVSGGMDSCVTAAVAAQDHDLAFLHVNYGQRTEGRELRAFEEIAGYYGVSRCLVVDDRSLSAIGGSSLTDASMPTPGAEAGRKEVPTTYVPFRNAHLLCIGVSWAEVLGARKVYVGVEAESGYPDCRPVFIEAFNRAVATGTRPGSGVEVVAPLASDDLFFVSRNDGTHVFCPTLACHEAQVRKWQVEFFRRKQRKTR
jgi:7-cyano-7-deazaguanine synthase